jgi:hypothetical protein
MPIGLVELYWIGLIMATVVMAVYWTLHKRSQNRINNERKKIKK